MGCMQTDTERTCNELKFRKMTLAQLREESFIDLGYAILEDKKNSLTLGELFTEIQTLNEFTDEEMAERKPQFYTDMNIDGRFLAIAENQWGLREWYPVEQIEEESAPTVKVRKKKSKTSDDLDDMEEDEIIFEEEFDEFAEEDDEDDDDEDEVVGFVEVGVEIDEVVEEDIIDEEEDEFEIDEDLDDEDLDEEEE